jgi:hypothetical protein
MNISMVSVSNPTQSVSTQNTETTKHSFSDSEYIDALISLADMLDAASDTQDGFEEQGTSFASKDNVGEERFSFLSGWDRLMVRFKDSCHNRKTYRICF